jgi:hypothetical protein
LLTLVVLPAAYVFVQRSSIQTESAPGEESEGDDEQPVPVEERE